MQGQEVLLWTILPTYLLEGTIAALYEQYRGEGPWQSKYLYKSKQFTLPLCFSPMSDSDEKIWSFGHFNEFEGACIETLVERLSY